MYMNPSEFEFQGTILQFTGLEILKKVTSHFCDQLKKVSSKFSKLGAKHGLIIIIIHSKYFPDSDWLKAHT